MVKENNKDIDKVLDEILNENITVEDFQNIAARSLETNEYEKINALLLDYYNKANKTDFQSNLKQQLKLMVNEKILSKLTNSKDLEKEKERKIDEESKKILSEENVDEKTLDNAKENVKQRKDGISDNEKEFDLRAEIMKQVYIEEFKIYSNKLYKMKEQQAEKRELTVGEKNGTELVLHEKYLVNLEKKYIAYAKNNKLSEKTLNDNKEIFELKDKLEYQLGKKEEYIDDKVGYRLNNFRDLYNRREKMSKELSELVNSNLSKENPIEFKKKMDYYQEEYRKITYKIRAQDPSLQLYRNQIEIEQENKEFAYENVSEELQFQSGYSDKQVEIDKNDVKYSDEKRIMENTRKDDQVIKSTLDEIVRKYNDLIYLGKFDEAEECLQSAEDMVGLRDNEKMEADGKYEKVSNEKLDKYMDEKVNEKDVQEINNEEKNSKDPYDYEDEFSVRKEAEDATLESEEIDKKNKLMERYKRFEKKYYSLYGQMKENEKDEVEFLRQR